jgi:predicted NAD/FAD-binding protein
LKARRRIGQDISIGHSSHSGTIVELSLQETFTFRPLTAEASRSGRSSISCPVAQSLSAHKNIVVPALSRRRGGANIADCDGAEKVFDESRHRALAVECVDFAAHQRERLLTLVTKHEAGIP